MDAGSLVRRVVNRVNTVGMVVGPYLVLFGCTLLLASFFRYCKDNGKGVIRYSERVLLINFHS